jgi:hypothetical protein
MTKRFSYLSFAVLILCEISLCQPPPLSWARKIAGKKGYAVRQMVDMKTDTKGYCYVLGTFVDTVNFGLTAKSCTLNAAGNGQATYLMKVTPSGQLSWVRKWQAGNNDPCNGLVIDTVTGNIYVLGVQSTGAVSFTGGVNQFFATAMVSAYVAQYNSKGDILGVNELVGVITPSAGVVDRKQNLIITGSYNGGVDFDPSPGSYTLYSFTPTAFVLELDKNGAFQFVRSFNGSQGSFGLTVATDKERSLYVAGYAASGTDMDPGPASKLTSSAGGFIVKLDSTGLYKKSIAFYGDCEIQSIEIRTDGYYATGSFADTISAVSGAQTTTVPFSGNNRDVFFLKTDTACTISWVRRINSINGTSSNARIFVGVNKSIYLFVSYSGSIDADPGPAVYQLTSANGYYGFTDLATLKFDPSGTLQWTDSNGPGGFKYVPGAVGMREEVYTSGSFMQTNDFDPTSQTYTLSSSPPGSAGFLKKLYDCSGAAIPTITVVQLQYNPCENDTITLAANGADFYYWGPDLDDSNTQLLPAQIGGTIEVTGFYANEPGCPSTRIYTISAVNCTGLERHTSGQIGIYPNPAENSVTISAEAGIQLLIIDSMGQTIEERTLRQDKTVIDIARFEEGVYFFKLFSGSDLLLVSKVIRK